MAGHNKVRTVPYRILTYLLYGKYSWIQELGNGKLRIRTGPAARTLRIKSADFWEYLGWMETNRLIISVSREPKPGTALIELINPCERFTAHG